MADNKVNKYSQIFKYILGFIYIASAILKLMDFEATAMMMKDVVHLDIIYINSALFILIITEASIAAALVLDMLRKVTKNLLLIISVFFIGFNLFLILNGFDNCGCYGASIKQSPYVSIVKNIAIIIMTFKI